MIKTILFIILSMTILVASQNPANPLLECQEDNSDACINLARYLEHRKDHSNALKLYKRACSLGNAEGCLNAGHKYFQGLGTGQNASIAIKYYTASFKQGIAGGYVNIGNMYLHGKGGVAKDKHKAYKYFQKACEAGHKTACLIVKQKPNKRDREQDYKSIKSLDKLCDDGRIIRSIYCNSIAGIYEKYEEYDNAVKYYKKGCTDRLYRGCLKVGEMYLEGKGVEQDRNTGLRYIEQGCSKGDHEACFKAGTLYEGSDDILKAKEFFKKACDLQFAAGCEKYGLL